MIINSLSITSAEKTFVPILVLFHYIKKLYELYSMLFNIL
jgi:hypothetical protein